jgi:hypothetical protein
MATPFDKVIKDIKKRGYHNHRLEDHSNIVSLGILKDLLKTCPPFREDFESGVINRWFNVHTPGARQRKIDLLIGQQLPDGRPDLNRMRICLENKSVITAHRNRDARFDDLNESLQVLYRVQPETVLVATVLIGTCDKVLNVPDKIKQLYRKKKEDFDKHIVPRLSSGDQMLWKEFDWAVSENRLKDPEQTVDKFRQLQIREPSHTHKIGYDFLLLVPVAIDNVNPPKLARRNTLGINIDKGYHSMLEHICKTYNARWHL